MMNHLQIILADQLGKIGAGPMDLAESRLLESVSIYNDPSRIYHNVDHIRMGLRTINRRAKDLKVSLTTISAFRVAWILHDLFVESCKSNFTSIQESAGFVYESLYDFRVPNYYRNLIYQMICVTEHGKFQDPFIFDACIIHAHPCVSATVCLDFEILSEPEVIFTDYRNKIRGEYVTIDDATFTKGTQAFAKNLLERSRIFPSSFFSKQKELNARNNLRTLLE